MWGPGDNYLHVSGKFISRCRITDIALRTVKTYGGRRGLSLGDQRPVVGEIPKSGGRRVNEQRLRSANQTWFSCPESCSPKSDGASYVRQESSIQGSPDDCPRGSRSYGELLCQPHLRSHIRQQRRVYEPGLSQSPPHRCPPSVHSRRKTLRIGLSPSTTKRSAPSWILHADGRRSRGGPSSCEWLKYYSQIGQQCPQPSSLHLSKGIGAYPRLDKVGSPKGRPASRRLISSSNSEWYCENNPVLQPFGSGSVLDPSTGTEEFPHLDRVGLCENHPSKSPTVTTASERDERVRDERPFDLGVDISLNLAGSCVITLPTKFPSDTILAVQCVVGHAELVRTTARLSQQSRPLHFSEDSAPRSRASLLIRSTHNHLTFTRYWLKVAGIYIVRAAGTLSLNILRPFAGSHPITWVVIRPDDVALGKFLCVDPLNVSLLPKLVEIIFQRAFTKVRAPVSEISEEDLPSQCETRIYQKGEYSPFSVLLRHVLSIAPITDRRTGIVIIMSYRVIQTSISHVWPVWGKLYYPCPAQSRYGFTKERIRRADAALNGERYIHENRADRGTSSVDAPWSRYRHMYIELHPKGSSGFQSLKNNDTATKRALKPTYPHASGVET